jgi:hypothetical protein
MGARPRDAIRRVVARAARGPVMLPPRLRHRLVWSPLLAIVAQLVMAAAAAAVTGGADFPLRR